MSILSLILLPVVLLVPGLSILSVLKYDWKNGVLTTFVLALVSGICIIPFVQIFLSSINAINAASLVLFEVVCFVILIRQVLFNKGKKVRTLNALRSLSLRYSWRQAGTFLLIAIPIVSGIISWNSAIPNHPVDMGWHVFWTKKILADSHLADYSVIEPYDQASRFIFGPHALLSAITLLTDLDLEHYSWVPLMFLGLLEIVSIYFISYELTGSKLFSTAAATFYPITFFSGGYIQRGNLSDLIGYFILTVIMWCIIRLYKNQTIRQNWIIGLLGLFIGSLTAYHINALLVFIVTFVLSNFYLAIAKRDVLVIFYKNVFGGRQILLLIIALAGSSLLAATQSTYLNSKALGDFSQSNWLTYVSPLPSYFNQFGAPFFALGLLGLGFIVNRNSPETSLILAWFIALVLLANGPLLHFNVEPHRFLWRMAEPLAISIAILLSSIYVLLSKYQYQNITRFVLLAVITFSIISVQYVKVQAYGPSYYDTFEPYYETDRSISDWLIAHANHRDIVAMDVDVDNTSTWVQSRTLGQNYLYKVEFGTWVAPSSYRLVFQDLSKLYSNPSLLSSAQILEKYNMKFIVASGDSVTKFDRSPFLQSVYKTPNSAIFEVKSKSLQDMFVGGCSSCVIDSVGYVLNTSSGREVLLAQKLIIRVNSPVDSKFTLPVYPHLVVPKLNPTQLAIYANDVSLGTVKFGNEGRYIDYHLGYDSPDLWPWMQKSGIGVGQKIDIPIVKGVNIITLTMTNDIDFEVYVDDLLTQGISIDYSSLEKRGLSIVND